VFTKPGSANGKALTALVPGSDSWRLTQAALPMMASALYKRLQRPAMMANFPDRLGSRYLLRLLSRLRLVFRTNLHRRVRTTGGNWQAVAGFAGLSIGFYVFGHATRYLLIGK
jgi:hypothetical protein